ncbi:hypothetical protein H0H92_004108 [Tricholoma furcatifolium]|nr:hypothetical protein H0H92_004108 [Tricholoma furcatifolium]
MAQYKCLCRRCLSHNPNGRIVSRATESRHYDLDRNDAPPQCDNNQVPGQDIPSAPSLTGTTTSLPQNDAAAQSPITQINVNSYFPPGPADHEMDAAQGHLDLRFSNTRGNDDNQKDGSREERLDPGLDSGDLDTQDDAYGDMHMEVDDGYDEEGDGGGGVDDGYDEEKDPGCLEDINLDDVDDAPQAQADDDIDNEESDETDDSTGLAPNL